MVKVGCYPDPINSALERFRIELGATDGLKNRACDDGLGRMLHLFTCMNMVESCTRLPSAKPFSQSHIHKLGCFNKILDHVYLPRSMRKVVSTAS